MYAILPLLDTRRKPHGRQEHTRAPPQFRRPYHTREVIWKAGRISGKKSLRQALSFVRPAPKFHVYADRTGLHPSIANLEYGLTCSEKNKEKIIGPLNPSPSLFWCLNPSLSWLGDATRSWTVPSNSSCFFALLGGGGLGGRGGGAFLRTRNKTIFLSTEREAFVNDE